MPRAALRILVVGGATLTVAAVAWLIGSALLRIPLVTLSLALALLVTALVQPVCAALRRTGLPAALSALTTVLLLVVLLAGAGLLVGFRATEVLRDLTGPLTTGIDQVRQWLTEGPLGLDPGQVTQVRNEIVTGLYRALPNPTAGARMALHALVALALILFVTFFLLKDGARMWAWALGWVSRRRRAQVDGAGRAAWETLSGYVRGTVVVGMIDAIGIGAALLILGVPLWFSLTLLTFLGAFIPLVGATVAGAVAVLITMVTNDLGDAVIVLIVVLVVQQLEGNLLQPLIMSRAVALHPVAILAVVTAGGLLFGIPGALFAVPLVAVAYHVLTYLRSERRQAGSPTDRR